MKYIKKLALIALAMAGFNIQGSETLADQASLLSDAFGKTPEVAPAATQGILSSLYSRLPSFTSTPTPAVPEDAWTFNVGQLRDSLLQSENRMGELSDLIQNAVDPQEKVDLIRQLAQEESIAENLKTGISSLQGNFLSRGYNTLTSYVPSMDQLRALPTYAPYFGSQWGDLSRNQQIGAGLASAALLGTLGYGAYRGGRSLYDRYRNRSMGIAPMSQGAAVIKSLAQQQMNLNPDQLKQDRAMHALLFIKNINMSKAAETNVLRRAFFEDLLSDINDITGLEKVADAIRTVIKHHDNATVYRNIHRKTNVNKAIDSLKAAIDEYLKLK